MEKPEKDLRMGDYKVMRVSATQLDTYLMCQRKWWLERVEGIKQPPSKSMELGTDVHNIVEHYIRDGKVIPDTIAGSIAKSVMPMVAKDSICEHQFTVPFIEDIEVTGRIDFTRKGHIEDLKTTSNIRYAKSPQELQTNTQALIYLWASGKDDYLRTFGPINKFSHLVVETKPPFVTKRVDCEIDDETINKGVAYLQEVALSMKECADRPIDDARPNISACSRYGGCHLQKRCAKDGVYWSPQKRKDTKMNPLIAKMRQQKKEEEKRNTPEETKDTKRVVSVQKGPPAPEPEKMPTNTQASAINPPDGISDEEKVAIPQPKKTRKKSVVPEWVPEHGGKSVVTLKKAESVHVYTYIKEALVSGSTSLDTHEIKKIMPLLDWSPEARSAAECKSMAKKLIDELPSGLEAPKAETPKAETPKAETPKEEAPKSPNQKSGWLFVGCRPAFTVPGMVHLDDLLSVIRDRIQQEDKDNRHWLVIHDYGLNGSALVAASLRMLIDNGATLPPAILADYRMPGHGDCISILKQFYNLVEGV